MKVVDGEMEDIQIKGKERGENVWVGRHTRERKRAEQRQEQKEVKKENKRWRRKRDISQRYERSP